jgi:PAS domain S-box-containing protein
MKQMMMPACLLFVCVFGIIANTSAQQVSRPVAISAYIYNFAKNVQWQNEDSIKAFHFLIIGDNQEVITAMTALAKTKKIRKKPIIVTSSATLKNFDDVQLIFLTKGNEEKHVKVFDQIEGKNILLVSDGCLDKKLIMINFFDSDEGTLLFEINKANIINQHITIMPEMILLGGTVVDVAALYQEGQQSLRSLQKKIDNLDSNLIRINNILKTKTAEIEENKDSLNELTLKILEQKEFLEAQSLLLKQRENELEVQILKISSQQKILENEALALKILNAEIKKGKDTLLSQKSEIDKQKAKLELQKSELLSQSQSLEKQGSTIHKQQNLMYWLGAIILLVVALVLTIFYAYKNKQKLNKELENRVAERTVALNATNKQLQIELNERKLAEDKLVESEKRYRHLFEHNPVPMLIYELGTLQMISVNEAFLEHYGYSKDQISSMLLPDLYPDDQKKPIADLTLSIQGQAYVGEWKHRKADGTFIDILATSHDITYKNRKARIAVINDITDRKIAEQEKLKTLSKLEAVFDANTDVVAIVNAEGVFLGGNKALLDRWGKKYDNIIGHSAREILPEHIFNSRVEKIRDVIKTGKNVQFIDSYNDNWFEVRISPVIEADGSITTIAMYSQNITERKTSEAALRESEEKYRTVIESATDSIIIIKKGIVQYVNPLMIQISGYSEAELLGKPFIDFVTPKDKARVIEYYQKRTRGEEAPATYEVSTNKKNGEEIFFEITVTAFTYMGEGAELVFLHDITERKLIEHRILKINEELEERVELRTQQLASANKELEAFAYSVSHDLRAPLRAISGFAKILTEDYAEKIEDEGQRICGVIQNETSRMGQLIDDLLSFSRLSKTSMKTAPSDMNALVLQMFEETKKQYQDKQVNFIMGNLLPATFDISLMRQVWVNLISNAFKFSSKKEIIEIEIGSYKKPGEIIYFIKDNGAGFDMKYIDKLFGVFQRLHTVIEFQGTGVGLAIVQRIIYRHGGRIWAEGELNKGAKFIFSIPDNK